MHIHMHMHMHHQAKQKEVRDLKLRMMVLEQKMGVLLGNMEGIQKQVRRWMSKRAGCGSDSCSCTHSCACSCSTHDAAYVIHSSSFMRLRMASAHAHVHAHVCTQSSAHMNTCTAPDHTIVTQLTDAMIGKTCMCCYHMGCACDGSI